MVEWSVRGQALATPARAGGINAEKGFHFQRSYAAWLLSGLLTNAEGVTALRYEGAQDVDLWLNDGAEVYVQVKGYESTEIDWAGLRKIMSRFVDDLQVAGRDAGSAAAQKLKFRLVATGAVSDVDVLNLARGMHNRSHAPRIARELSNGVPPPSLKEEVRAVLTGLSTEFYPANVTRDVFRLMAESRLARFGVGADDVDGAIRVLLDRLTWRKTIRGADVLEWIGDLLPVEHPCSGHGAITSFAARVRGTVGPLWRFYTSQGDIWQGISNQLDVPRDIAPDLRTELLSDNGSKYLVFGPSGADKSTLARRVLWDLQLEGRILALELRGSEPSDAEWSAMVRLAKRLQTDGGTRVVLLIDDIHNLPQLANRVADLDPSSGMRIVATTWSRDVGGLDLGGGILKFPLLTISRREAVAVAGRLSRELAAIPSNELETLLQSGQFLVLNLALLEGGDVTSFGRRVLESVHTRAPQLVEVYVDVCACGIDDRSVPIDVLCRIHSNALALVANPEMAGLISEAGAGRIRSGHRVMAEAVVAASSVQRPTRLLAIAGAVDAADGSERRFGIGILEDLVGSGSFPPSLALLVERLVRLFAASGDYLDIRRCARILVLAGRPDEVPVIKSFATFERVRSGPDAAAYRSDRGRVDPEGTFDDLLGFYSTNPTTWGWRNFLHMAKELDAPRRTEALLLAKGRLEVGIDVGTAKVTIDLMNTAGRPPDWALEFVIAILLKVPDSVDLARATAQLLTDHFRSPDLFRALLEYAATLIGTAGDPLLLARNLGTAARYADAPERRRLLDLLLGILGETSSAHARATILHTCATLAAKEDIKRVAKLLEPAQLGEPARTNTARHILRKKI